jgi:Subtilase family
MLGQTDRESQQMVSQTLSWEEIGEGLEHGGYVAWESAVDAALGVPARDHVPVFIELAPGKGMTLLQAIDQTLAERGVRLSRHERDLLATERAHAEADGTLKVRTVVFWPRSRLSAMPSYWKVLRVGPPLAIPDDPGGEGVDLSAISGDLDPAMPVVAVIDDGIGFLNARFRRAQKGTRIRSVWLQAQERGEGSGDVLCGRVLDACEIDDHLTSSGSEAEHYREMNRSIYPHPGGVRTDAHVAHGTHVLDLAAGAAPWSADWMREVPILAVQLPPASVHETAGRRMETYLLQGLRWILAEALRQANHTDLPPVIVNISLGSAAGPGDKQAFVADWFEYEIARHKRLTKGELRLVVAYGNARPSRLVAREEIRSSQPLQLIWRAKPDDHTSSFMELRVDQMHTAGLEVRLVPPRTSGLPELKAPWPAAGTGWRLGGTIAAVTSTEEAGGKSLLHLALGPTSDAEGLDPAPAGAWQVVVETNVSEPVRVTARVQRDDTPPGYRTLGRQSWLDHPRGWNWDPETRAYVAPQSDYDAPGCPVTREGTPVAYAGAQSDEIYFVGAARPEIGNPDLLRPTRYSSEGVRNPAWQGESRGPTLAALGDDGVMLGGRRAAGVLSGAVVRMSGTSMAAPMVTRALALYFRTVPRPGRSVAVERKFLTGTEDWTAPDPRMGHGTLTA